MGRWRIVWVAALLLNIRYLWWLVHSLMWSDWFLAFPFFGAECYFAAFLLFSGLPLFFTRKQCRQIKEGAQQHNSYASSYIVAVIPVCGEPPDVVRPTIQSVSRLATLYESVKIFVSDDTGDAEIRRLAEELGVGYCTHPPHQEAKAGNLNRALEKIRAVFPAQWLLVIDAGDTIDASFLTVAEPHMDEERIAFIQGHRRFHPSRLFSLLSDDRFFYGVIMPKRNIMSAAFACGSGVLWRVKALDAIGGFSSWNIVEDLTTSYMLQRNGWRGTYIITPLLTGGGPLDLPAFVRQRFLWAVDSMRILFWQNPLKAKMLPWRIRLAYAEIGFAYLLALPIAFVRLIPVIAIWGAFPVLNSASWEYYWVYFLPAFFARMASEWILFRMYHVSFAYWYTSLKLWEGLVPVHLAALWHTFRLGPEQKILYTVTPKVTKEGFHLFAIRIQLTWFLIALCTIGYGFFSYSPGTWLFTNIFWIVFGLWLLFPFLTSAAVTSSPRLYHAWHFFLSLLLTFCVIVLMLELDFLR